MKVFLVKGESGEYDDYSQWNVKAFVDKDKALKFKRFLNQKAKEFYSQHESENHLDIELDIEEVFRFRRELRKYDRHVDPGWDQIKYSIQILEVEDGTD